MIAGVVTLSFLGTSGGQNWGGGALLAGGPLRKDLGPASLRPVSSRVDSP